MRSNLLALLSLLLLSSLLGNTRLRESQQPGAVSKSWLPTLASPMIEAAPSEKWAEGSPGNSQLSSIGILFLNSPHDSQELAPPEKLEHLSIPGELVNLPKDFCHLSVYQNDDPRRLTSTGRLSGELVGRQIHLCLASGEDNSSKDYQAIPCDVRQPVLLNSNSVTFEKLEGDYELHLNGALLNRLHFSPQGRAEAGETAVEKQNLS